ncbi:MAG: hypothetical protein F4109_12700 [Gammaproteobacteria bacterium]|nr:hypothetical protein [Gammaproteobacteria bacterium]MYD01527.1 hypothetical protein [Gammaproteobacteria bacterium]MYI26274.1 hypothetical protein [Gammaproteobacteria bacterium]
MAAAPAVRFLALCVSLLLSVGGNASEPPDPENAPALSGAELNWTMSCRGCHGTNAEGTEGGAPNMAGQVSRFLKVEGGRQYLVRVPGVAFASLSDAEVAELMNWMLWKFDKENIPDSFSPYDEKEVGRLREKPLLTSVAEVRRELILKIDDTPGPDHIGKVLTVTGAIEPDRLGETLMHEHLFIDFWLPADEPARWNQLFGRTPPTSPEQLKAWRQPLTMHNRTGMAARLWANRDAFTLDSLQDALDEVSDFRELGGGAIVDVTSIGLNRQPEKLKEVSERTGVRIVMGTGYYRTAWHPVTLMDMSVRDLALRMYEDITVGVNGTTVKAGIIGEIPIEKITSAEPVTGESKVLRAAAMASSWTGAAISIHSDFYDMSKLTLALDLLERDGADLSRVILGHISNAAVADLAFLEGLLQRGVFLQFDVFGNPWQLSMNDLRGAEAILSLVEKGYSKQILVSHDLCTKFQLTRFGGFGLKYVHTVLLPYFRDQGMTEAQIDDIMTGNPARVLPLSRPWKSPH